MDSLLSSANCYDLLSKYVERSLRNPQTIEFASMDAAHERRTFNQLIPSAGENSSFGHRAPPVSCTSDSLQRNCNGSRRADVANEIDKSNINSQFKGCSRHQDFDFAFLQFLLRREA